MFEYKITLIKDFSIAEKTLPKFGFVIYKNIINSVYKTIVERVGKSKLKDFNPVYEGNKAIFTMENEDKKVLQKEEEELKDFLLSDAEEFKKDEKVNKAMNNRWVKKVYIHTQALVMNKILKNNVLTFLNSMSMLVKWEINELKEANK